MNICVSKNDFNGSEEMMAQVVKILRHQGFTNVYTGEARPSRGDMALADVLRLAGLVSEARGVIMPDKWPVGGMEMPADWAAMMVFAAARSGHDPLRVLAQVWAAWDIYDRTEAVYNYVERCKEAERRAVNDKPQKLVVNGSARLQTAVSLVVKALPVYDGRMLDYEGVEVVEIPGLWSKDGLRGKAESLESGYRIEIDTTFDNKSLLHTVAHEFLHVTRRHTDLLKEADGDRELLDALTVVFEKQVKALVGRLAYDAVPEFTLD